MLDIHPDQMEILSREAERANLVFLRQWIERDRPHLRPALEAGELGEAMLGSLRLGRELGVESVEAVGALLELWMAVGPGFEREPPIAKLLEDEAFPPDARPRRVLSLRSPGEWAEFVRASSDPEQEEPR